MQINPHALRVIRERSGLSQAALARAAKVSQGHISQLEAGHKEPRPDMVKRLARTLRVPIAALVGDPSEAPKPRPRKSKAAKSKPSRKRAK